ncbi:oxidoreductase domain-containing protein [Moniliophthora roreri]|nr:oxidoreductase domain-containing protein [Moniliophthora roreri]
MQAEVIDFSLTPLASSCTGLYAKVIDNAFTPAECEELLNLAALHPGGWKPAGAKAEALVFDESVSRNIFDRRIEPRGQWAGITGDPDRNEGPVWILGSVNPNEMLLNTIRRYQTSPRESDTHPTFPDVHPINPV